jgi:hypothetical protein
MSREIIEELEQMLQELRNERCNRKGNGQNTSGDLDGENCQ